MFFSPEALDFPKRVFFGEFPHVSRWCHAPLVLGTNARHAKGSESDRWIPLEGGKLGGCKRYIIGFLRVCVMIPLIFPKLKGGRWFLITFFGVKQLFLGGGFRYFLFSPGSLGKWSNLTNVFQRGWNHQLDRICKGVCDDSPNLP